MCPAGVAAWPGLRPVAAQRSAAVLRTACHRFCTSPDRPGTSPWPKAEVARSLMAAAGNDDDQILRNVTFTLARSPRHRSAAGRAGKNDNGPDVSALGPSHPSLPRAERQQGCCTCLELSG